MKKNHHNMCEREREKCVRCGRWSSWEEFNEQLEKKKKYKKEQMEIKFTIKCIGKNNEGTWRVERERAGEYGT